MTHKELVEKASSAQSPTELLEMAKESGIEMDEASAAAYFAQMNKTGELADDELDSVAGGGCYHDGRLIVTVGYQCSNWECDQCGGTNYALPSLDKHRCDGSTKSVTRNCNHCKYCSYEDALWLCNHPAKRE